MALKIYTKTGDLGETGLFGGERLSKGDLRIETYGTIDELNAHLGLLRDGIRQEELQAEVLQVQTALFTIGSHLAVLSKEKVTLPDLDPQWVLVMEKAIDRMDGEVPALKHFILPGGHPIVSQAHICRCVCRRAERRVVSLSQRDEVDPYIIIFLNRLSDYLFILGRKLAVAEGVEEIPWKPQK